MAYLFYPNVYIKSIYDIDTKLLMNKEINNIIIDIDNTLSKWGSKEPEPSECNWIKKIRGEGFNICILSNSSNSRIKKYCSNLDVLYIKNVRKPFKKSFIRAMNLLKSNKINTCVIGDQIFTDILGGNKCGMFTILVQPLDKNEFLFTRLMRSIERRIIGKY